MTCHLPLLRELRFEGWRGWGERGLERKLLWVDGVDGVDGGAVVCWIGWTLLRVNGGNESGGDEGRRGESGGCGCG
jgi:hypothetical protein